MGITLTGKRVQNTYDSLLKLSSNDNLTATPQLVGDGLGNDSPIYLSETKVGIGVSPSFQFQTSDAAKIGGNLTVGGNLIVEGSTTQVDSTIVEIGDNMIELAKDNISNIKDIGWYGTIVESGTKYVGFYYDASSGITTPTFYLGYGTTEPSNTASWTTKGKIVIGQIDSTGGTFSGQITIPETPTADGHAASKKYVDDQIGGADKARRVTITVKNTETVALSAGTVVHAHPTAPVPSGNIVQVKKADYDTASLMPAIAILNEDLDAAGGTNDEGEAIMFGFINGIDTSSFSAGDELYVGNDGALTNSKPLLTTQLIQKIAVVMKVDSTNGSIEVFGAGRSNDVPNEVDRDLSIAGNLTVDDYINVEASSGYGRLEIGGPTGGYIDLKTPFSDDYDLRMIFDSGGANITSSSTLRLNSSNTNAVLIDSNQDTTFYGEINVLDGNKIYLGSDSDLEIYHDGTDGYIDNINGELIIQNNSDDKKIIFKSDNGVGGITDYFIINGLENTNEFKISTRHNDNVKAFFGDGSDLQIYHDGSNSYISDTGTGNLFITGASNIYLQNGSNETYLDTTTNGAVRLYHDNSLKFETTSVGIYVNDEIRVGQGSGATNQTGIIKENGSTYGLGLFTWGDSAPVQIGGGSVLIQKENGDSANLTVSGNITLGANYIGRDADNYIDFSTDNEIDFKVGGGVEITLDASQLYPVSNYGSSVGKSTNRWNYVYARYGNFSVDLTTPLLTLSDHLVIENGNSTYSVPAPANTNVPLIYLRNTNNTSGTTTAHSIITLRTQINGGDPFISFDVENETGWTAGMDNSDNSFKITTGWNDVGGSTGMAINTSGQANFYQNVLVGNTSSGTGNVQIATSAGAGWGSTAYPYIGSDGSSLSLIFLHNPHTPYRTDNVRTGASARSGLRMARNASGNWWDMGLIGDEWEIYRDGTGQLMHISNTGNATFTGNVTLNNTITTPTNTNLKLQPNGSGNLYLGDSGNGFKMYHYSYLNDGVYTSYEHNSTKSIFFTTASNGFSFSNEVLIQDDFHITSASTYQGFGWNRNVNDGTIFNSSMSAFQMFNDGDLKLQGYNSSGINQFEHIFYSNGDLLLDSCDNLYLEGNIYTTLYLTSTYSFSSNRNWAWRTNTFGAGNWGGLGLWQSASAGTNATSGVQRFGIDRVGNVGMGYFPSNTAIRARLHVRASTSEVYANTDSNNVMYLERDNHAYMLFAGPDNTDQGFHFLNSTDNTFVGRLAYKHSSSGDEMAFRVGQTSPDVMSLMSGGGMRLYRSSDPYIQFYENSSNVGDIFIDTSLNSLVVRGAAGHGVHLKSNGNTDASSEGIYLATNDYVGINTKSPATYLSVNNGSYFVNIGSASFSWAGSTTYPTIYGSSTDRWVMYAFPHIVWLQNGINGHTGNTFGSIIRYAATSGYATYWDAGVSSDYSDKFVIRRAGGTPAITADNTGRVGIGTTTPSHTLTIGSGQSNFIRIHNAASGDISSGILIERGTATGLQIYDNPADNATTFLAAGRINFRTNGSQRVAIDTSGRVGINESSPATDSILSMVSSYQYALQIGHNNANSASDFQDALFIQNTNTNNSNYVSLGMSTKGTDGQHHRVQIRAVKGGGTYEGQLQFYMRQATTATNLEKYRFYANGEFHADSDIVAFSTTISDKRLKDEVITIDSALDKVKQLRGVEYVWNSGSKKGKKDLGVIAQEVEKILPEIVTEKEMAFFGEEKYKTVDYEKLTAVLIESVKELSAKVEALENRNCNCNCK